MTQLPETVPVAYTKLSNGHGFQAADKTTKWLLVTASDLNDAIGEVSKQLTEILGGEWTLTAASKKFLFLGIEAKDKNVVRAPFSGFAGVMYWAPVAV